MRAVFLFLLALAPLLSLGAPLRRSASQTDILVLNFAHVLEQLETQFYTEVLTKFTATDITNAGYSNPTLVVEQLQSIMNDEATHTKVLTGSIGAVGGTVVSGCTFNFDSVLTDINTAMAAARVVENVGVAAYLGAAHLLQDPRILEAAGSIVTVEARHQTILNIFAGSSTAIPSAFDLSLTPNEVLAMAGPFISGCDLGVPANTPLTLTNTGGASVGTLLSFSWQGMPSDLSGLNCQMMAGGSVNSISLPLSGCVVPSGLNGPVAVYVTNSTNPLLNNVVDRAQSQTVAGPTFVFLDQTSEALSQLVRPGASGAAASNGTVTDTSASNSTVTADTSSSNSTVTPDMSAMNSTSTGPNLTTGPGPDGAVNVAGWTNLPTGM